ncbi:MAG: cytochrome P450 [Cytophagales bacterium]|nr:MAG: cytochrome P450 [Cytophagales bacterium]
MATLTTTLPVWNPFTKGYRDNPYDHLRLLREQNPVHRGINGRWMVLPYEDVKASLGNPVFQTIQFSDILTAKEPLLPEGHNLHDLSASVAKWLLFMNPPDHTQLRTLVVRIWNQYKVRALIEEVVTEALDRLRKKRHADLIADFAESIPMQVVCRILGLPATDHERLRIWSKGFARAVEPFNSLYDLLALNTIAGEFYAYIEAVLATKRNHPDDSFLSRFMDANDLQDEPLSYSELVSVFIILFFAGIETSVYLFGHTTLNLLLNPEQFQFLRENPACTQSAVEEFIRFACPLQYTPRVPSTDVEIRGVSIRAGEIVMLSLASANRDPAIFAEPERLKLDRTPNPHLSFGHSFHHCLGARLAREEMQVAIPLFVQQFPDVRLHKDCPPVWERLITNRGLQSLPVCLTP